MERERDLCVHTHRHTHMHHTPLTPTHPHTYPHMTQYCILIFINICKFMNIYINSIYIYIYI